MKASVSRFTVVFILLFPFVVPAASDINYAATTSINYKTGEYIPEADPDTGFVIEPTTLDIKFTVFSDRFFTAINFDSTIRDDYSVINKGTIESVGSRLDYGLTTGYRIIEGLNLFLGYKVGETEVKSVRTTGATSKDGMFRDKGPFIGVNYGYRVGELFSLSLNAAYADFDGEVRLRDNIAQATTVTSGKTSGYSYGFKVGKDIREGTQIAIGFKRHEYTFKDDDQGPGSFNVDQSFETIYVEYTNFF